MAAPGLQPLLVLSSLLTCLLGTASAQTLPPLTLQPTLLWSAAPVSTPKVTVQRLPQPTPHDEVPPQLLAASFTVPVVADLGRTADVSFPVALHPGLPAAPALATGQQFLRVTDDLPYQQHGQRLPYPALSGRLLTLTRLTATQATFDAEGLGEVTRPYAPQQGLNDLAPVVSDPEVQQLQQQYQGHAVWGYGGLRGTCSPTAGSAAGLSVTPFTPVTVRHVLRLRTPMLLNAQGQFGGGAAKGADAWTRTPLVFLLDPRPFTWNGGFSASGDGADVDFNPEVIETLVRSGNCLATLPVFLPDTWAVTRIFSQVAPPAGVPRTQGPVKALGLTREQYAWLAGFPSAMFGTRDELLRVPVWSYRNVPFPATVTFGADGRVTSLDVPDLP